MLIEDADLCARSIHKRGTEREIKDHIRPIMACRFSEIRFICLFRETVYTSAFWSLPSFCDRIASLVSEPKGRLTGPAGAQGPGKSTGSA